MKISHPDAPFKKDGILTISQGEELRVPFKMPEFELDTEGQTIEVYPRNLVYDGLRIWGRREDRTGYHKELAVMSHLSREVSMLRSIESKADFTAVPDLSDNSPYYISMPDVADRMHRDLKEQAKYTRRDMMGYKMLQPHETYQYGTKAISEHMQGLMPKLVEHVGQAESPFQAELSYNEHYIEIVVSLGEVSLRHPSIDESRLYGHGGGIYSLG